MHFEKYFARVELFQTQVRAEVSIDDLLQYRRRNSAFLNYLQQHGKAKSFSDPSTELASSLKCDLDIYCHRTKKLLKPNPITMRTMYFVYSLTNRFPK